MRQKKRYTPAVGDFLNYSVLKQDSFGDGRIMIRKYAGSADRGVSLYEDMARKNMSVPPIAPDTGSEARTVYAPAPKPLSWASIVHRPSKDQRSKKTAPGGEKGGGKGRTDIKKNGNPDYKPISQAKNSGTQSSQPRMRKEEKSLSGNAVLPAPPLRPLIISRAHQATQVVYHPKLPPAPVTKYQKEMESTTTSAGSCEARDHEEDEYREEEDDEVGELPSSTCFSPMSPSSLTNKDSIRHGYNANEENCMHYYIGSDCEKSMIDGTVPKIAEKVSRDRAHSIELMHKISTTTSTDVVESVSAIGSSSKEFCANWYDYEIEDDMRPAERREEEVGEKEEKEDEKEEKTEFYRIEQVKPCEEGTAWKPRIPKLVLCPLEELCRNAPIVFQNSKTGDRIETIETSNGLSHIGETRASYYNSRLNGKKSAANSLKGRKPQNKKK